MLSAPWRFPKISTKDLAWLAGLLEGEGCFSEQRYFENPDAWYVLPSIQLNMTDRDVVVRAGSLLGGNQKHVRSNDKTEYKRQFIWRVNGRRAVHVMQLLLPFMGKRRTQRIQKMLKNYEKSVGPKGARGFHRYRKGFGPSRQLWKMRKKKLPRPKGLRSLADWRRQRRFK